MREARRLTFEDIAFLAPRLRTFDVIECAAFGVGPRIGLLVSAMQSPEPKAIVIDGLPVAAFGVNPVVPGEVGCPWLLATEDFYGALTARRKDRATIQFLRANLREIDAWQKEYTVLTNVVHAANIPAQNWLRWLGFRFFPKERQIGGHPFIEFIRTEQCASP